MVAAASFLKPRPSSSNVMGMRRLSSGTIMAGSTNAGRGLGVAGAGQEVRGLGRQERWWGGREEGGKWHKEQSILSSVSLT